jgi:quercetin dioxygenase-like cupin family protein
MTESFLLPSADGRASKPYNIFGNLVTIKVASADTDGRIAFMHDVTPPGGGPPLHLHLSESETFYVLYGDFRFELDGKLHSASAGDTVFIPAGVAHRYQNAGSEPGHMLIYIQPGGLDAFFGELDALLKEPGEPSTPAIAALHERFNMKLMGPPLSAEG